MEQLADESPTRYDLFFLCEDDMPYDDTPDRSGAMNRAHFQWRMRDELARRKVPYLSLRGTLDERIAEASAVLERFEKYRSIAEIVRPTRA